MNGEPHFIGVDFGREVPRLDQHNNVFDHMRKLLATTKVGIPTAEEMARDLLLGGSSRARVTYDPIASTVTATVIANDEFVRVPHG